MRANELSLVRRALAGLLLAGACSCGHSIQDGTYQLTAQGAAIVDSCNLAPPDGSLWSGQLSTSGKEIFFRMAIPVPGLQEPEHPELAGFFKDPQLGQGDGFLADATDSDVPAPFPGVAGGCLADTELIHADAEISDDQHFNGLLQLTYSLTPPGQPLSPCQKSSCKLEAHFTAARVGP
jgi:hypothetical protein